MQPKYLFGSVTRIAGLRERDFEVRPVPRADWDGGDYVVGEVIQPVRGGLCIELPTGRHAEPMIGDLVVGALGHRAATLEMTGDWHAIGPDGRIDFLTAAGVVGRMSSKSPFLPDPIAGRYRGHVFVEGRPAHMHDYAIRAEVEHELQSPVVLIVGTSMSSGKTMAARLIVRLLRHAGLRVAAGKLSGAGRYRDTLAMRDAGAVADFDFVDAGLPTTVCSAERYLATIRPLLSRLAEVEADAVVVEAGASPIEPYNGDTLMRLLGDRIRCMVLCASDPYAVMGIMHAFDRRPDVVTGIATNTSAGIQVIEKQVGVPALNVQDPADAPRMLEILERCLPCLPVDASAPAGR
ncbi:MAG: DUF1611 domain-containing protein [Caldilineae bacterium]|nr:DUF1611 domain-containing protein [Caldilineae bacterium]